MNSIGLRVTEGKKREKALEFVEKVLRSGRESEECKKAREKDKKILIAEVATLGTKHKTMKKKCKLGERKVYIDHDLTYKERKIQRKMREMPRRM